MSLDDFTPAAMEVDPQPNLPLLRKVLDHIDAHPEEWNQGAWMTQTETACGTAFCVAGHAIFMNGQHKVSFNKRDQEMLIDGHAIIDENDAPHVIGREVLGLTEGEATRLFNGGNNRARVQVFAEQIAARAGETL